MRRLFRRPKLFVAIIAASIQALGAAVPPIVENATHRATATPAACVVPDVERVSLPSDEPLPAPMSTVDSGCVRQIIVYEHEP